MRKPGGNDLFMFTKSTFPLKDLSFVSFAFSQEEVL